MGGGQTWITYTLAAVLIVTSAYCLSRLVLSWRQDRRTERSVDAKHALMGVAMAGMLVPSLRIFWAGGWEVVFGIGAVGFAWLAFRELRSQKKSEGDPPRHHHLQHVLACAAMVYMLAAIPSAAAATSGAGMSAVAGSTVAASTGHFRTLALVLALALFGYVIWTADRFTSLAPVAALSALRAPDADLAPVAAGAGEADLRQLPDASGSPEAPARRLAPLSPRLAACCEIIMGVTMGYMLILML